MLNTKNKMVGLIPSKYIKQMMKEKYDIKLSTLVST